MCDSCGSESKDIAIRAASYGVVRYAEGIDGIDNVITSVGEAGGLKDERVHKPAEIFKKALLNGVVDYGYGKYIYPKYKQGMEDKIGLCECEFMTGIWQIVAQMVYESMYGGGIKGGAVLKDIIAIYAQFPIHNFLKKKM